MASDPSDEFGARLWGGPFGFSTRMTTLFALALLVAASSFGWYEWRARSSLNWPSTQGIIITHSSAGDSNGTSRHRRQTVVFYDYTIDGVLYHGDRIAFHLPDEFRDKPSPYAAISAGMNRFPMGSTFPVYYDPTSPQQSILLRTRANWTLTGTLASFATGAVALAIWLALEDCKAARKRGPRLWPLPANAPLVPTTPKGKPRRSGRSKGRP